MKRRPTATSGIESLPETTPMCTVPLVTLAGRGHIPGGINGGASQQRVVKIVGVHLHTQRQHKHTHNTQRVGLRRCSGGCYTFNRVEHVRGLLHIRGQNTPPWLP